MITVGMTMLGACVPLIELAMVEMTLIENYGADFYVNQDNMSSECQASLTVLPCCKVNWS